MEIRVRNRIGGDLVDSSNAVLLERRDPAYRSRTVSVAPDSSEADVTSAVDAAREAAESWGRTTPSERAEILGAAADIVRSRIDAIAAELVAEQGKPYADAAYEVSRVPRNFDLYAGEAYRLTGTTFPTDDTRLVYSELRPVGVVGVITPWNFPLNLASRKIGAALAAGNTVVFKPSPLTPLMGERLAAALHDAGLPGGVLNVVHGHAAGAHLVADRRVDAITFTGSTATGRKIHSAMEIGRRVQLELGGKNPIVVLADADLNVAAELVAKSAFVMSGQACTGAGRVLVEESVHDDLVDRVVQHAQAYKLGPGDTPGVTMGPLINDQAVHEMTEVVARAQAAGATVRYGGRAPLDDGLVEGSFFSPTVLTDVEAGTEIATREVFGPVIGFERVLGLDEAITSANSVEYGLSAAICTSNLGHAQRFIDGVQAGMIRVNRPTAGSTYNTPFGGIKQSGTGMHREALGPTVMDFFTSLRTVSISA